MLKANVGSVHCGADEFEAAGLDMSEHGESMFMHNHLEASMPRAMGKPRYSSAIVDAGVDVEAAVKDDPCSPDAAEPFAKGSDEEPQQHIAVVASTETERGRWASPSKAANR